MGFAQFLDDGRMSLLEGYVFDESTSDLDLSYIDFSIEGEATG